MPGCIDWKRLAIEVEVLFNHQPFIDISVFVFCKSFSAVHWFTSIQHSELYTAYYINNLHIKIWGLPLLMEKWFYCQYGTCRMVKCFHIMNALLDRIHDLTKVIIFIKIVKLCITVNYADLPHGMGKGISDSQK